MKVLLLHLYQTTCECQKNLGLYLQSCVVKVEVDGIEKKIGPQYQVRVFRPATGRIPTRTAGYAMMGRHNTRLGCESPSRGVTTLIVNGLFHEFKLRRRGPSGCTVILTRTVIQRPGQGRQCRGINAAAECHGDDQASPANSSPGWPTRVPAVAGSRCTLSGG